MFGTALKTSLPEWVKKARNSEVPPAVVARIEQLRRGMLVHCCIYYRLDSNVISDHAWMDFAQELARLQERWGVTFGFYDDQFKDWDGSSGFHLEHDANILAKARWLLDYHYSKDKQ